MKTHIKLIIFGVIIFISGCQKKKMEITTYQLTVISGQNQIGEVLKNLSQKVHVRLTNNNNQAVEGALVQFKIVGGEGTVAPSGVITNASGVAEVTWKMGQKVGMQEMEAWVMDGDIETNVITLEASAICPNSITYSGTSYPIVQIDNRCWFAKNLLVGTKVNTGYQVAGNNIIEYSCYNDSQANCTIYGGMYTWDEVMQNATTEKTRGICPTGWHIPSKDEWGKLISHLGTKAGGKMKSPGTSLWKSPNTGATNESGFNALPAGFGFFYFAPKFLNIKEFAGFWTSTKTGTQPYILRLNYNSNIATLEENIQLFGPYYSCRCILNE